MRKWRYAVFAAAMAAGAGSAMAQQPPSPLAAPGPRECPPDIPNDPQAGQPAADGNLSERLSQSKGVICPPANIDPNIREAPPGGGRTPVIPPPGSPGGDPTIVPK
jgi:hypothetical protein